MRVLSKPVMVFGAMAAALWRLRVKLAAMVLLAVAAIAAGHSLAFAHATRSADPNAPGAPGAIESAVRCEPRAASPVAPAPIAPSDPTAGVAIATLGFAILLGLTLRRGRTLTLGLIAALAILTYEAGVHSVHHLGSPADASRCAIAAAMTHLHATVDEPPVTLVGPAYAGTAPVARDPACLVLQAWRAWRGRAPPFSSIA